MSSSNATSRLLVRVPQWLGDAVVSTVFLDRLKKRYPGAPIAVLAPVALAPIFTAHPAVSEVLTFDRPTEGPARVAKKIRAGGFDRCYVLPRSARSALEVWLARVPRRVGFGGDLRALLLTDRFPHDPRLRYAHRYLRLIDEENLPLDLVRPFFPATPESDPALSEALGGALSNFARPFLGVAPASVAPARTWPLERFAAAARAWQRRHGGTMVILGSAIERDVAAHLAQLSEGPVLNTAGRLSLPQLGAVVKTLDRLIANDSGLMHVAACFEIPTVVVFGASDPERALPPWGRFVSLQKKILPCVPCLRNHCVLFGAQHNACLNAIKSEDVEAAVETLVSTNPGVFDRS